MEPSRVECFNGITCDYNLDLELENFVRVKGLIGVVIEGNILVDQL